MALSQAQEPSLDSPRQQTKPRAGRKLSGVNLASVGRAARWGTTATMNVLHLNRSPNRVGSPTPSPAASAATTTTATDGTTVASSTPRPRSTSGIGFRERNSSAASQISGAVIPARPSMQRVMSADIGGEGSDNGYLGSGAISEAWSERRRSAGRGNTRSLPRIRKGYLLMLRETMGGAGDGAAGSGGSGGGVVNDGGGSGSGEWLEKFFYLSGHFLRYKKHSLNITSVNLRQTDHVEFNLQSAAIECMDYLGDTGDNAFRPRKTHGFRLVTYKPTAAMNVQGGGGGGGGVSTGPERRHDGGGRGGGGCKSVGKVWSLAANSPEERAMWIQAIREAISFGQELLQGNQGCGEPPPPPGEVDRVHLLGACPLHALARNTGVSCDVSNPSNPLLHGRVMRGALRISSYMYMTYHEGSLHVLAARMSSEIEIRDRRYRLRVYRSCFLGEDAISWLQSESECGPCSVEEALVTGSKMVAAGLIYHCTYGHDLQNNRLFYKFADSVVAASRKSSGAFSGPRARRSQAPIGLGQQGGVDDGVDVSEKEAVGRWAGEGSDDDDADVDDIDGEDEDEDFGVSDAEGSLPSPSTSSRNGSYGDGQRESSVGGNEISSPAGNGSGDGDGDGRGIIGEAVKAAPILSTLVGSGNAMSRSTTGADSSDLVSDGKKAPSVKRDSLTIKKIPLVKKIPSVKKMARELEGLKLTCAELERSQMDAERQSQDCAIRILACLETSLDRLLVTAVSTALLVALGMLFLTEGVPRSMRSSGTKIDGPRSPYVPGDPGTAGARMEEWEMERWAAYRGLEDNREQSFYFTLEQRLVQLIMISLVGVTLYAFGRSRAAVRAAVAAAREVYAGSAACDTGRGLGTRNGGFGMGEPKRRGDICAVVPLLHPSQVEGKLVASLRSGIAVGGKRRSVREALARVASNRPIIPDDTLDLDVDMVALETVPSDATEESSTDKDGIMSGGAGPAGDDEGLVQCNEGQSGEVGAAEVPEISPEFSLVPRYGQRQMRSMRRVQGRPEVESLPQEKDWPHHPIFVRLSPSVPDQVRLDGHDATSSIPVNSDDVAVPFETPLFKGRLLVRVAGLPSRIPGQGDGAQEYFRGKKRLMQCAVQGCFKREIPFDRAYTGQAYARPFTRLPAKWLIRSAFSVIRRLSPALREDITGDNPYMVSPLAATAQAIRAEVPGDEAAIVGDLGEETALLGASFMDRRVPASARKKFFSSPRNLKAYSFKPGVVYTFDFYQHLYNAVTFELDLGFRKVKLADYLNHQPAQIMAMDFESGEMLWNVEIWNSALLKVHDEVP